VDVNVAGRMKDRNDCDDAAADDDCEVNEETRNMLPIIVQVKIKVPK